MTLKKIFLTICTVLNTIINEPSNKGEVGFRLIVSVLWQIYKRIFPFPLVLPLDNRLLYIADTEAVNATGAIYTRIYESQYIIFLRQYLENARGGCFVDIGAHTGLYTLLLAPYFTKGVCFEPDSVTFQLLRKNLAINHLVWATPVLAAASDNCGVGQLRVMGKYSGTTRLFSKGESCFNNEQLVEVDLLKVDDVLDKMDIAKISLMKIDTEGHELQVLKGAIKVLKASRDALVIYENSNLDDSNFESVCGFFELIGWKVFGIDRSGLPLYDKDLIQMSYNLFACGPDNRYFIS
jgi:FkbM family methyltransferase